MAATAAVQQPNTNDRGIYFIGIERRFCAPSSGLTASACLQSGLLAVTNKVDAEGNKINTITRQEIKELINVSPATASRNNKRFENSGRIRKQGVSTYVYSADAEGEEIKKWYCPTEILTQTFPAEDDDGNTYFVNFTYCDALVYSPIYTLLPHTGPNKRTLKMTFKEMAETLGIDESTVSDSIRKLRQAGLIHFPNGWRGLNRYKKSRIQLKRGFTWFKREQEYRALLYKKKKAESSKPELEQKAPKTPQTPHLNHAEARQRYYSGLQAKAAQKAAQSLEKALKNNDFRKLNAEYGEIKHKHINAILHNDVAALQELASKIKGIEEKRAHVLKNIGIQPEELDAEYYVVCTECKDTGARADGSACDCWKPRRRGSPPGTAKELPREPNKKI